MATVDAALKELASAAQILNKTSDDLTRYLGEVESALVSLKLGVSVWVKLGEETELSEPTSDGLGQRTQLTIAKMLGYGKLKNKWGLLVAEYCEEFFDGQFDQECFLRDAPREIRLASVEKLPDLLKALIKKAKEIAEETTKRAGEAKAIAASLVENSR